MLRSRPFAVPRLGYRARIEDNAFNLFLHSRKSWLKWKSVEAERGSPSLTRTTQAKKIMDILRWSTHEDNLKTKRGFRLTIHLGYLPANTQAWNISRLEFIHHCCWPIPCVQPLPRKTDKPAPKIRAASLCCLSQTKRWGQESARELPVWKLPLFFLLLLYLSTRNAE